ncbi:MAG TPA: thioesterase family protein [Acidobacteriota bacterium]|jgi:YbgC/YbaW family acyl-CoA thioester hydrolase
MSGEFIYERRVDYSDTDMGGIVHFSRFFVYMETAEHELLRARGTSIDRTVDGRRISWPRVAASCEYTSPARYGDVLQIHVRVARHGVKSMTYAFEFFRENELIAKGEMTSACCIIHANRPPEPIPIPEWFAQALERDTAI